MVDFFLFYSFIQWANVSVHNIFICVSAYMCMAVHVSWCECGSQRGCMWESILPSPCEFRVANSGHIIRHQAPLSTELY